MNTMDTSQMICKYYLKKKKLFITGALNTYIRKALLKTTVYGVALYAAIV